MKPESEAWDELQVSVLSAVRIRSFTPHVGRWGLRLLQIPNRAHRERWDNLREKPFKAHLCGDPKGLRLLPLRSRDNFFIKGQTLYTGTEAYRGSFTDL